MDKVETQADSFIEKMASCKDLIALKNLVKDLLHEDDAAIDSVFAELMALRATTAIKRAFVSKPYAIYSGNAAAVNFMLTHITTRQSAQSVPIESPRAGFENFVCLADENIVPKVGPLVLRKDIEYIIKEIDRKYLLFSTLFGERKLSILRVSNTHLNCNALCCSIKSEMGVGFITLNYELFLFHEREGAGWHPAFIFLHELGHILQTEISRNPSLPPKSFVQMVNLYKGPRIKQDKESAELFADAFAIAMITIFEWKQLAPQVGFPPATSAVYAEYIDWLIGEFLMGHIQDL